MSATRQSSPRHLLLVSALVLLACVPSANCAAGGQPDALTTASTTASYTAANAPLALEPVPEADMRAVNTLLVQLRGADTDGDGTVSGAEYDALSPEVRQQIADLGAGG